VAVLALVGCGGKKEKEAAQADRLAPFVPEGYTILSATAGNLNLDKFEDMLLIIERKEEMIGEEFQEEDRVLIILLGQKGGKYKFAAQNDKVVCHSNAGGTFTNEPLDSVGIKDGYFSVKMMGGSRELWTNTITFKYSIEDKSWYLYTVGDNVIDRLDPDNMTTSLKTVEDFGKVSFEQYGQEADGGAAAAANTFTEEQQGYRLFEELYGDLNGDGKDDYVAIIKGTDKGQMVKDENSGELVDRNRRGILISFNNGNDYQRVLDNRSCFESENEEGGTYFPPELSVSTGRGNLYIAYNWGKYGQWKYTFRYRNGEFVLIGYDAYSREMPNNYSAEGEGEGEREVEVVETESSYNLLTKKVFVKTVTSYTDGGSNTNEKWDTFVVNRLVKLIDIQDFREFDKGFSYK
jgi:hypothetical protein